MIWMHRIAEVALPMFRRADADAYGADELWHFRPYRPARRRTLVPFIPR
jgi:hypothetical protein